MKTEHSAEEISDMFSSAFERDESAIEKMPSRFGGKDGITQIVNEPPEVPGNGLVKSHDGSVTGILMQRADGAFILKAKKAEVGATSTHGGIKVKKDSSGKWKPVGGDKKDGKKESGKKPDKAGQGVFREALKSGIKAMITAMTNSLQGRGEGLIEPAEQAGAEVEAKGKQAVEEKKRAESNVKENARQDQKKQPGTERGRVEEKKRLSEVKSKAEKQWKKEGKK